MGVRLGVWGWRCGVEVLGVEVLGVEGGGLSLHPSPQNCALKATGATRKPITFQDPRLLARNHQPKILDACP